MFRITQLARKFGLSRSTLLYYDRIGLLTPAGRTEAGYRRYSQADCERLDAICTFRRAGLSVAEVKIALSREGDETSRVLSERLRILGEEVRALRLKQRLLTGMLHAHAKGGVPLLLDKEMWVEMLRAAGMSDDEMCRWHSEFERRAPESHHEFLLSLGIPEKEALMIRKWSAAGRDR